MRMTKVKIAMILNSDFLVDTQGGVETYVKELTQSLEKKGIDVYRVGILASDRNISGKELIVSKKKISNYLFLFLLFKIALYFRRESNIIIHVQRPEQIVPFLFMMKKNSLVSSVHGPAREGVRQAKGWLIGSIYAFLETLGLRMANSIIFVDRKTLEEYISSFPWLRKKSKIVPAGISDDFLRKRIPKKKALSRLNFDENDKVICFIGRLEHEKNVHLIIRAFTRIASKKPELKLTIAGDGSLREELQGLTKDLGISNRTIFLGKISHERVRELLSASEALVMASKFEGSPLVVRESLALGTRIVSTNVGDVSEYIQDESQGIIVPESTENAITEGILRALSTGKSQAPPLYIKNLSWDRISEKVIKIYQSAKNQSARKFLKNR